MKRHTEIFRFVILLLPMLVLSEESALPVVMWHGMGDICLNPLGMAVLKSTLEKEISGVYVKSLCFGDSPVQDSFDSFFLHSNKQVEQACQMIATDPKLKNGYNALGFSQGGQFLRAVAQRCPRPKMKILVTFGAQHQGVYGFPHCLYPNHSWCDYVRRLLTIGAYWSFLKISGELLKIESRGLLHFEEEILALGASFECFKDNLCWVQNGLVQAQYWKDPRNLDEYVESSTFLADINNERAVKNSSYALNLASLEKFVMVRFNNDTMVEPIASEWFEFYKSGQGVEIEPLENTPMYKEDWLGLKELDKRGALHRLAVDGDHLKFSMSWFISNIVHKYLSPKTGNL